MAPTCLCSPQPCNRPKPLPHHPVPPQQPSLHRRQHLLAPPRHATNGTRLSLATAVTASPHPPASHSRNFVPGIRTLTAHAAISGLTQHTASMAEVLPLRLQQLRPSRHPHQQTMAQTTHVRGGTRWYRETHAKRSIRGMGSLLHNFAHGTRTWMEHAATSGWVMHIA